MFAHLQVKGRVGHHLDDKAHLTKTSHYEITLVLRVYQQSLQSQILGNFTYTEVTLKMSHLSLDQTRVEHRHSCLLERVVGTSIEVATT